MRLARAAAANKKGNVLSSAKKLEMLQRANELGLPLAVDLSSDDGRSASSSSTAGRSCLKSPQNRGRNPGKAKQVTLLLSEEDASESASSSGSPVRSIAALRRQESLEDKDLKIAELEKQLRQVKDELRRSSIDAVMSPISPATPKARLPPPLQETPETTMVARSAYEEPQWPQAERSASEKPDVSDGRPKVDRGILGQKKPLEGRVEGVLAKKPDVQQLQKQQGRLEEDRARLRAAREKQAGQERKRPEGLADVDGNFRKDRAGRHDEEKMSSNSSRSPQLAETRPGAQDSEDSRRKETVDAQDVKLLEKSPEKSNPQAGDSASPKGDLKLPRTPGPEGGSGSQSSSRSKSDKGKGQKPVEQMSYAERTRAKREAEQRGRSDKDLKEAKLDRRSSSEELAEHVGNSF